MTVAEAADTLLKIADRDKIIKLLADIEKTAAETAAIQNLTLNK